MLKRACVKNYVHVASIANNNFARLTFPHMLVCFHICESVARTQHTTLSPIYSSSITSSLFCHFLKILYDPSHIVVELYVGVGVLYLLRGLWFIVDTYLFATYLMVPSLRSGLSPHCFWKVSLLSERVNIQRGDSWSEYLSDPAH